MKDCTVRTCCPERDFKGDALAYLFNTPDQQQEMLQAIGVQSIDDLFEQIPQEFQLKSPLKIPAPLPEMELEREMRKLAARNTKDGGRVCMLGGGAYDHFIPAVVDEIVSRGEFYTAYTPYQAEASQGSLQAFFEYQTLISRLSGMDVSNASLYEGGTSVSEAAFMAMRVTGRHDRVVVLGSVHPEYREVLATYLHHLNCELVVIPTPEGSVDPGDVEQQLDEKTACLIIQHPNFFGCLEEVAELTALARKAGALSVVAFDPISVGVLNRPGDYGADIAVAEGQPLGIPLQYGGPLLGILSCRKEYVRKMPGRLIGQTVDKEGRRSFVLNLQAREQHIRRDKATSNICTNQGLLALRATVYLSLLGPQGLKEVAEACCQNAHYAVTELQQIDGVEVLFDRPFFKEFSLRFDGDVDLILRQVANAGFEIGPHFERFRNVDGGQFAGWENSLLVAMTEKRTKAEIDGLVKAVKNAVAGVQEMATSAAR